MAKALKTIGKIAGIVALAATALGNYPVAAAASSPSSTTEIGAQLICAEPSEAELPAGASP